MTPQSHHDFDEERTLRNPQPKNAQRIKIIFMVSRDGALFSGKSTTSPRSRGVMRSIPSVKPVPYFSA